MGKNEGGDVGREAGGAHLDAVLRELGLTGNAEFARLADITEGMVSKYRNGKARPTNETMGKIVKAIVKSADAQKKYFDPAEFYIRFGLISRDELEQEPVDEIFVELIELDHQAAAASEFEFELFREQLRGLIELTQERLRRKGEQRRAAG